MGRKDIEDIYPLAAAQRGMLFSSLAAPGTGLHVEQLSCRIAGSLDEALFRRAWGHLAECHAALRTAFVWKDRDEPLQVVLREVEVPVASDDWRHLGAEEREARLERFLDEERRAGFTMTRAPLCRLALFRTGDDEHRVVWTHHHILMDGWCSHQLLQESLAVYRDLAAGARPELPRTRPYGDFVEWLNTRDLKASEAFWRAELVGIREPTRLGRVEEPTAVAAPAEAFGTVERRVEAGLADAVRARAQSLRVTANTLVQGGWALALARAAGTDDVVFGVTVSGRPAEDAGFDATIGLFIATLPLRVRIAADTGVGAWLQALQERNAELREHGHLPAGELRQWCETPAHLPLFESAVVFENFPVDGLTRELATTALRIDDLRGSGARTDFAVTLLAALDRTLSFKLVHRRSRVPDPSAERMLEHLERYLALLAAPGDAPPASLLAEIPEAEVPVVHPRGSAAGRRDRPYVPPRNLAEEIVAGVWGQVLGLPDVGAEDDFFDLGGHSLVAAEAITRLRQAFRLDLRLRHLFGAPTVAAFADAISRMRSGDEEVAGEPELPVLRPDPDRRHEPFPLTDIQQAYWIGRGGDFELGNVSTHVYTELDGEGLDVGRLERAWRLLIERHEMLRAIVLPGGEQKILDRVPPYRIPVADLGGLAPDVLEGALAETRGRMSHQVLPADRWPLFDLRATRLDAGRVRLHLSFDLLIGDGWSLGLLLRDLSWIYMGHEAALPVLDLSFRDYVLAEMSQEKTAAFERSRRYWLDRLPTLPAAPDLPRARAVPDGADGTPPRFTRRQARLAPEAWRRIQERASALGLTGSTLLLAAFSEILAIWSRAPRFTVNLTLFHRLPIHPQVQEIVGDFTTLTLLEVDCASASTFSERARKLQERLWDDLDHRRFTGVRVLRELARRTGGAGAAMPVVFTSTLNLKAPAQRSAPPGAAEAGLRLESIYGIGQTPQVLIDHQVGETPAGGLRYNWDTVDEAFPDGMLDEMFGVYRRMVERMAAPDGDLDGAVGGPGELLPERHLAAWRALQGAGATAAGATPEELLHEPFLRRAAAEPDAPAVIAPDRTLTYGDLDRLSAALAHALRREGVGRGDRVAVVMEKGWEEAVAALGALRAGAAYLPIDARHPADRIRHLLERGRVSVALVQGRGPGADGWPDGVLRLVVSAAPEAAPEAAPRSAATPDDLAYVIFTSGSTGRPKGVMIDHRSALNTIHDVNRRFGVGPGDRVLALSALGFDLSVWDLFGVLGAGGAVVLPAADATRDPEVWLDLCRRHGVTLWNTVPALMEMLTEVAPSVTALPDLRLCLLSGDWIPLGLPDRIRALAPTCRVVSLGGATEASIWSIVRPVGRVEPHWTSVPYGRPLERQAMWVLDHRLAPRPEGVAGDLFIGGAGVARGYWDDPARTAAAFGPGLDGGRLYRTGDLALLTPEGELEFLGREDTQVKIRGHRIELGEIEATLLRHPEVQAAAVAAEGAARSYRRLVAYVVPTGSASGELTDRLREHLESKLPAHMVPSAFATLENLPLSANGKVDRSALAGMASKGTDPAEAPPRHVAPRNDVEERLAAIWAEVLEIESVGVEDGFLELGGDSIKAIQVLTRARESGIELTVRQLFERQTVALLAEAAKLVDHAETRDEVGDTEAFSVGDLDAAELEGLAEEVGG